MKFKDINEALTPEAIAKKVKQHRIKAGQEIWKAVMELDYATSAAKGKDVKTMKDLKKAASDLMNKVLEGT